MDSDAEYLCIWQKRQVLLHTLITLLPFTHARKENTSSDIYTSMKLCCLFSHLCYFHPLTSGLLAGHGSCVLLHEWKEFSKVGQLPPCESDHCFFVELCFNLFKACMWLWVIYVCYLSQWLQTEVHNEMFTIFTYVCVYVCFAPVGLMLKICINIWTVELNMFADKSTAAENVLEYWRT